MHRNMQHTYTNIAMLNYITCTNSQFLIFNYLNTFLKACLFAPLCLVDLNGCVVFAVITNATTHWRTQAALPHCKQFDIGNNNQRLCGCCLLLRRELLLESKVTFNQPQVLRLNLYKVTMSLFCSWFGNYFLVLILFFVFFFQFA